MSTFKTLIYTKRGHVAYITLNRPAKLNAMTLEMHEELRLVWDDFEHDRSIWLGVLTGAGNRAFSVGQDLHELASLNEKGSELSSFGSKGRAGWPRLTERHKMTKPLIARVNGYALGGGFELAMACDIIVASDNACFALPEAKLGLVAGAGGLFRLPRLIPPKIALGYAMTGRHMNSERAFELGLVNEVVAPTELDACIKGWVDDLLKCSPYSLRTIKEVHNRTASLNIEAAFSTEYEWDLKRRLSQDPIEGPMAFIEGRCPKWQGF